MKKPPVNSTSDDHDLNRLRRLESAVANCNPLAVLAAATSSSSGNSDTYLTIPDIMQQIESGSDPNATSGTVTIGLDSTNDNNMLVTDS